MRKNSKKKTKKILLGIFLGLLILLAGARTRRRIPPSSAQITMSTEFDKNFLTSTQNRKKNNQEIRSQKIFSRRSDQNFRQKLSKNEQKQLRSPEDLGRRNPTKNRETRTVPRPKIQNFLPQNPRTGQQITLDQEIRYIFKITDDTVTLIPEPSHTRAPIRVQIRR